MRKRRTCHFLFILMAALFGQNVLLALPASLVKSLHKKQFHISSLLMLDEGDVKWFLML